MNKERAKQFFEEIKEVAEKSNRENAEPIYDLAEELKGYSEKQIIEFCDIAIESLEQNIQTIIVGREFTLEEMNKGLEYCTYKAHRELIKRLLELKLIDIKSMNDIFGKGTVEFRLKVAEPYKRKNEAYIKARPIFLKSDNEVIPRCPKCHHALLFKEDEERCSKCGKEIDWR